MSALDAHATAARIIGECILAQVERAGNLADGTLKAMGAAYLAAADKMEAKIKGDANARVHTCIIDHRMITVPRCPACGAPRLSR